MPAPYEVPVAKVARALRLRPRRFADASALRDAPSKDLEPFDPAHVDEPGNGGFVAWDPGSKGDDDGKDTFQPKDRKAGQPGRWRRAVIVSGMAPKP